eukprot:6205579-Pleurochrysis_carterae.AAC.3
MRKYICTSTDVRHSALSTHARARCRRPLACSLEVFSTRPLSPVHRSKRIAEGRLTVRQTGAYGMPRFRLGLRWGSV